ERYFQVLLTDHDSVTKCVRKRPPTNYREKRECESHCERRVKCGSSACMLPLDSNDMRICPLASVSQRTIPRNAFSCTVILSAANHGCSCPKDRLSNRQNT